MSFKQLQSMFGITVLDELLLNRLPAENKITQNVGFVLSEKL